MGYNIFLHQNNIFQFFISMNFLKHVSFITRNKKLVKLKHSECPKHQPWKRDLRETEQKQAQTPQRRRE